MKKVIYNQYGSTDDLQLAEVEVPSIKPNELLIKVKTVAINPLDWKKLTLFFFGCNRKKRVVCNFYQREKS